MTTGTVVGSQVVDDWFYLRGRVSSLLCDNGGVQFVEAMKAGGGRDWDVDSGYLGLVEIWIHGGVSLCWVVSSTSFSSGFANDDTNCAAFFAFV